MRRMATVVIAWMLCGATGVNGQSPPLQGVWKIVSVTAAGKTNSAPQPSLYIFAKDHYSIVQVNGDKPRPRPAGGPQTATAPQLLELYGDAFHAHAGTYKVAGGVLTEYPVVAKSPGSMQPGYFLTFLVAVKGKHVSLTTDRSSSGPSKDQIVYKLERVE